MSRWRIKVGLEAVPIIHYISPRTLPKQTLVKLFKLKLQEGSHVHKVLPQSVSKPGRSAISYLTMIKVLVSLSYHRDPRLSGSSSKPTTPRTR